MSYPDRESKLTRRDFLRTAAAGAAATAGVVSGLGILAPASAGAAQKGAMKYRTLGRTGIRVSELGLGTIKTNNAAVIKRAYDLGLTYFDTAECYQGGNSEVRLGQGLKGIRDKVIVATKWHTDGSTPAAELLASLDDSLKRLGLEHVDLIQIHGAGRASHVEGDEVWEAFTRARKAGKVRFNGVTTHGNQVEVVRAAVKTGRYDAVLVSYNAAIGDRVGAVLAEAHKAQVGVIAMKVLQPAHDGVSSEAFKGLRGNPYQQAIQWVLRDPNVSTAIVDMPTFEELDENLAALRQPISAAALRDFELAVAIASAGACHLCGSCTGQCARGVQVADIVRCDLYHTGYGDPDLARDVYRALPAGRSAAACADCETCQVVCPWGVPVRSKLESMHARLA